jgi:ferric-dicitrate binding protein FerR (iron transport regulator)
MLEDLHNKNEVSEYSDMERKILSRASQFQVTGILSKKEAYQKLREKMDKVSEQPTIKLRPKKQIYLISAAAASIIILIGVWALFINNRLTTVVSPKGEHVEYKLPDGSLVSINAESKIEFNKKNFMKNRFVKLEGEAFFKVKKGNSFIIRTQYADIKVLGTSFNIFSRKDAFKVSCVTGKVQVKNKKDAVILTPGESATSLNNHILEFSDKNIENVTNWRMGEFNFDKTPLKMVFEEIGRQFNVTFMLPKVDTMIYTGGFSNKNLVDALDVVCIPMKLNYEIGTNSQIRIQYKKD